jgi:transglutaminase-like putative cysteine protease
MIPENAVSIRENALYGVSDSIREQVRDVVEAQARENLMEWQVPQERFVHTASGLKWKNADGSFSDPDTELKKLVASVIDSSTTADMSQKKQLQKCFDFFVATSSYERKTDYPSGNWAPGYAKEILSTGKGNCYNYAAAFAYVAKGLGYDARVCTGTVMSSLGGRTPHAWTEIRMGNNWYIFDAEMQGAKGSGYYKQTYDTYPAKPLQELASFAVSF